MCNFLSFIVISLHITGPAPISGPNASSVPAQTLVSDPAQDSKEDGERTETVEDTSSKRGAKDRSLPQQNAQKRARSANSSMLDPPSVKKVIDNNDTDVTVLPAVDNQAAAPAVSGNKISSHELRSNENSL
jgi:hypothetical protein